ncbi:TMEM165/GDT1 family protein [Blastococcus brunescens]|uniref:GDT1 family protein n=1 Tax=Blastococcus brunescens TaxID=1564165 RepID=A0ABZ1BAU0_9ACTN|nr:TMEM165/GDT1 family protein [Blastococcus sp. BMG 8361]WRL67253.1 TMEM165/GDT1 family protein [Blastococcus sp. BMG 8361]
MAQRLGGARGGGPGLREAGHLVPARRGDLLRRPVRRGVGDLSQLATAGLAARYDEPLSVFVGAWAALLVVSGLAVFLGKKLADRLPIALIRRVAAGLFVVFAVFAIVETVRALTG